MKKHLITLLVIMLIACVAIALVACNEVDENGLIVLKTPVLTVNGNSVTWKSVKNADSYGVKINDGDEIVISGTTYSITDGGANAIKVRAIGDLKKYGYSEYSASVTLANYSKLATPVLNDLVKNSDGSVTASWNSVSGATAYNIKVSNSDGNMLINETVNKTNYVIDAATVSDPSHYTVSVKAVGSAEVLDSNYSNTKTYSNAIKLSAPVSPKQLTGTDSNSTNYRYVEFAKVDNADKYTLEAYNDNETITLTTVTYSGDNVRFNINDLKIENPGVYKLRVRAEAKNNALIAPSDFVSVLKHDGASDMTVTKYAAPANFSIDGSTLSYDKPGDGLTYVFTVWSNKDSNSTTLSTTESSYDLAKTDTITKGNLSGLIINVTVHVRYDYKEGIIDGIKSDELEYIHVEEPTKNENGYYEIDTVAKLNFIASHPKEKYILTKNIDAKNGYIRPLSTAFEGIFDGNNYSISRFTLKRTTSKMSISLFGEVTGGAVIKNLGLFDAAIDDTAISSQNIGVNGAILANSNNGTVSDISITGSINVSGECAGVINRNSSVMNNVFFSGSVKGNTLAGGIVSTNDNNGKIINARIFSTAMTGSALEGSDNTTSVYLGGIAAINSGELRYCSVDASALSLSTHLRNGNAYLGGLAGRNSGLIDSSYVNSRGNKAFENRNNAPVGSAAKTYIGGFVGNMIAGSIGNSYAIYGEYKGADYASAMVGLMQNGSVSNSYAADINLTSIRNYIVSASHGNGASFGNLYYWMNSRFNHELSASDIAANKVTKVSDKASMNNDEVVIIPSMSKNTAVQNEFMTIRNMIYFKIDDKGYTGDNAKKSQFTTREIPKLYSGSGSEIEVAKKFDDTKADTNMTTYDIYELKISDSLTLTLTKTYKIVS